MKVSFKDIVYYPTLDGKVEKKEDFTSVVAEAVYQNASNFNEHKLAHRIAESPDGLEISPEEAKMIAGAIAQWRFFVQKPVLERLGVTFE